MRSIHAHWWYLLYLASELLQGLFDLLPRDMVPRCGAHLLPLAIVGVGLAPQQARRAILLLAPALTPVSARIEGRAHYLDAIEEFRELFRTFAHADYCMRSMLFRDCASWGG